MRKKLIKNSQPFGKNFQKTLGGIFFDSHCTHYKLYSHGSNVSTKRLEMCFERLVSVLSRTSGTDVSVSSRCCHSNVSISSRSCHSEVSSRLSLETLTSRSWHHTCRIQPCFVGLRAVAVWPIDFILQSKAMAVHVKMEVDFTVEQDYNLQILKEAKFSEFTLWDS